MTNFDEIWQLILLKMILKIVNVILLFLLLSTPKNSLPQLCFIRLKLNSWFKRRVYTKKTTTKSMTTTVKYQSEKLA